MKLRGTFAIAAFAHLALCASDGAAQVYLIRSQHHGSSSSSPQVPRQIARQIILQRLGIDHDNLLGDLPDGVDAEGAVGYLQEYGRKLPSLFAETKRGPVDGAAQGLLIVEGVKPEHVKTFKASLPASRREPAFMVRDPPSTIAVRDLVDVEIQAAGILHNSCKIRDVVNIDDAACWPAGVFVGSYDLRTSPDIAEALASTLSALATKADDGTVEVMLVLLPESSRAAPIAHWTSKPRIFARRAAGSESVITEEASVAKVESAAAGLPVDTHDFVPLKTKIPACFQSANSCMTQTRNCSGHGRCVNKYVPLPDPDNEKRADDDGEGPAVCFFCHCASTLDRPEGEGIGISTTHWAGNMCQKRDISAPFWMITIFSVSIIGALTFAIGMLFSVGEEKLPGVIGAGVSKAK